MAGRFALLIGNNQYKDATLSRLAAPAADVQALAEILRNPDMGGFDQVDLAINQSASSTQRKIVEFFSKKKTDDLLLFYFSGHGILDERGRFYLAFPDTERELLRGTALSSAFIADEMDNSRSKRQVIILDSCHSGAFVRGTKSAITRSVDMANAFKGLGFGRVILTASDATQYAWDGEDILGIAKNSLFTHHIIDGIRTGAADLDQDGFISLSEMFDYVYEQVTNSTALQTPVKWSFKEQGEIFIAKAAASPEKKTAGLPAGLILAIESPLASVRAAGVNELRALLGGGDPELAQQAQQYLEKLSRDDSSTVSLQAQDALGRAASEPEVPENSPQEYQPEPKISQAGNIEAQPDEPLVKAAVEEPDWVHSEKMYAGEISGSRPALLIENQRGTPQNPARKNWLIFAIFCGLAIFVWLGIQSGRQKPVAAPEPGDNLSTSLPDVIAATEPPAPMPASNAPQAVISINSDTAAAVHPFIDLGRGSVETVVYSPDGKFIATGTSIGIYLHEAANMSDVLFIDTNFPARHITFAPDGRTLASSTQDTVQLWRIPDGSLLRSIEVDSVAIDSLAFSPDGMMLAAGTTGGGAFIRLWRVSDGVPLRVLENPGNIHSLAFSPDGTTLASGDNNRRIRLWRLSDGAILGVLEGHTEDITGLAFSPDGKTLASGADTTIRLWEVYSKHLLRTIEDSRLGYVKSIAFSPDGTLLASGDHQSHVCLWRVSDGAYVRSLEWSPAWAEAKGVAFSPDGVSLVSGSRDNTLRLWRLSDGALLQSLDNFSGGALKAVFSSDDTILTAIYTDNKLRSWRVSDGSLLRSLQGDNFGEAAFSPDGSLLAVVKNEDGSISLLNAGDLSEVLNIKTDFYNPGRMVFSPDGALLAVAFSDDHIQLWRVSDGALMQTLVGDTFTRSIAFSPDGSILASGSEDGLLRLWRVSDGKLLHTLEGHTDRVHSVAFSPDGASLASLSEDATIRLWRPSDGILLKVLEDPSGGATHLTFSPDGSLILTSSYYYPVNIWRAADGALLYTLEENTDQKNGLTFSSDGTILAIMGETRIRLFSAGP